MQQFLHGWDRSPGAERRAKLGDLRGDPGGPETVSDSYQVGDDDAGLLGLTWSC